MAPGSPQGKEAAGELEIEVRDSVAARDVLRVSVQSTADISEVVEELSEEEEESEYSELSSELDTEPEEVGGQLLYE